MQRTETGDAHVLHVVPGLLAGGMELTMARVISGLNGRMRHTVVALKAEPEIADRLPSSTAIHCLHAGPNELRLPPRLARLIRTVRPTVIHARNWGAWPDTVAACLLTGCRIPLILSFHGLGRAGYMPLRRRAASHVLARLATRLFTVSRESKDLMVARWGWPEPRVQVIPNGVDTERFRPGCARARNGRTVVGTVGNLRPVKNHALLLDACASLVRQGRDVEVRIAGEGDERTRLAERAASLGLSDRVRLPGRVDDVSGFLQGLDIFVLSSDSEQHPNALNEAMACGLPCVATRVGCVGELLDEGRCGKIAPIGDREALSAAIGELVADPVRARAFGKAARHRACEHYSLRRMLDDYAALYDESSNGSPGRK